MIEITTKKNRLVSEVNVFEVIIFLIILLLLISCVIYFIYKYNKRPPTRIKKIKTKIECRKDIDYTINDLRDIYKFTDDDIILF